MSSRYLLIDSKVLPDIFEKVIKVKELLCKGKVKDVSEGVKVVGISRSTYYKYKDSVFTISENIRGQKVTISLLLEHQKGVLSAVLDKISEYNGNILTINQDIPINNVANVTITLNISNMNVEINHFLNKLKQIKYVLKVSLVSME